MSDICTQVQESIAWSRTLNDTLNKHVLECPQCSDAMRAFAELDACVDSGLDLEVPHGFANVVMERILIQEQKTANGPMFSHLKLIVEKTFYAHYGQLIAASVGSVIAIVNVIRFVLAVVIPVGS